MRENGSGVSGHLTETIFHTFTTTPVRSFIVFFFISFLLAGALFSTRLLSSNAITGASSQKSILTDKISKEPSKKIEIPLNCTGFNLTGTCSANYPSSSPEDLDRPSSPTCPDYFRWIHEDLRPWARTGITRDMVERAKTTANFRLVIVKGKAYVETFVKAFQTRDVFTLWGILQLLRRYPGKIPDLELMFDCVDWPVVRSADYGGLNSTPPPPLFRYCGDDNTLDIVFPDWSFWGWAEINIEPWDQLLSELKEGIKRTRWMDREPYAYWKGNPDVAETRKDLIKCNVSEHQDWNARLYAQNWALESQQGYKQSNLASQCTHRYKIYIEGSAWSVSEKYILACDSVTLIVKPHYYDFFTRGLMPFHHYWPIKEDDKCKSIKFAVEWGNTHKRKAQLIGKAASEFIQEELKMKYVYDYMFHVFKDYAKLLSFKPVIPPNARELCSEIMACQAQGFEKTFMVDSLVKGPAESGPCVMPTPYSPSGLNSILKKKETLIRQVGLWEKNYWDNVHHN